MDAQGNPVSCQEAAEDVLPRYLEDLCIQPDKGFGAPDGRCKYEAAPHWFMDDPVAAVFEMMDRKAKEVSKRSR